MTGGSSPPLFHLTFRRPLFTASRHCRFASSSSSSSSTSSSTSPKNYYQVLGVEKTASAQAIKTAFYTLTKKYHPDVVGKDATTSEQRYVEIKEAYEVLKDEAKRQAYDQQLGASGGVHRPYQQQQQQSPHPGRYDYEQFAKRYRYGATESQRKFEEEELRRIWRYMQENADYRKAKNFEEWFFGQRQATMNDFARRRAERAWQRATEEDVKRRADWRSQFRPPTEEFNRAWRSANWPLINRVVALYMLITVIVILYSQDRKNKRGMAGARNSPNSSDDPYGYQRQQYGNFQAGQPSPRQSSYPPFGPHQQRRHHSYAQEAIHNLRTAPTEVERSAARRRIQEMMHTMPPPEKK